MTSRTTPWTPARLGVVLGATLLAVASSQDGSAQQQGPAEGAARQGGGGPAGRGRANYSLSDPAPQDPALRGAIDLHARQGVGHARVRHPRAPRLPR